MTGLCRSGPTTHRQQSALIRRGQVLRGFALLCGMAACSVWTQTLVAAEPLAGPLAGKAFEAALEQRIGRTWGGVDGHTLRDAIRQLRESHRLSILLDRRIDPDQPLDLTVPLMPVRDVLEALSAAVGAEMSIAGNVVYLGPAETAKKLRTLIELRKQDLNRILSNPASSKSPWKNRPISLTQPRTITWQDLDQPRELLKQFADGFQMEIEGIEQLPHDLWAGASLPQVSAIEGLSLVLVQFGSTFEFLADRPAIRIVDIPDRVSLERMVLIPARFANQIPAIREQFADVEFDQSGNKLTVRGTVEELSAIADWLRTGSQKSGSRPANANAKPLNQRTFTLVLKNTPMREVIKAFTANGVRFRLDERQFADAEISLDQKVELDAKDIPADKLFRQLFEPRGIEVTIVDDVVWLTPKPRRH